MSWPSYEPLTHAAQQNPELIWPAQKSHNSLYWAPSRLFLEQLITSHPPPITLAYLDPPFASHANYTRRMRFFLRDKWVKVPVQEYSDHWKETDYLQFIYEQLVLIRALLSDTGSIVVHCDWHQNHHIRCILDQVFGAKRFQNELIFAYGAGGQSNKQFPRKHDTLFWYSRGKNPTFNANSSALRVPYDASTLQSHYRSTDEHGRKYRRQHKNGQDYITYADEGKLVNSVWTDLKAQLATSPISAESTGYPTQKPESLLERLILGLSNEGDWVLDPFLGSGTSIAVAERLNRRWIGGDRNLRAIETCRQRLGANDHSLYAIDPTTPHPIQAEIKYDGDRLRIFNVILQGFSDYFDDPKIDIWPDDWPYLVQCIDILYWDRQQHRCHISVRAQDRQPIQSQFDLPKAHSFRIRIVDFLGGCFEYTSPAKP